MTVSDPLELELQTVVNFPAGAGNQIWLLCPLGEQQLEFLTAESSSTPSPPLLKKSKF